MKATLGPYEVLGRIGQGGMAEVFRVQRRGIGGFQKTLVLKRILPHLATRPVFRDRFFDEARLAARLDHPHIIQIFDVGEDDGELFIVMEHVDGPSLRELLAGEPLPVAASLFITAALCDALQHAHDATGDDGAPLGLVHRDVSPSNVLVSRRGAVKLIDFGIAKVVGVDHTEPGMVPGKIVYMAPEQWTGGAVDRRADVYATGMTLYRMLAGRLPRETASLAAQAEAVVEGRRTSLGEDRPDLDPRVIALVDRAIALAPEARFATAAEMRESIEAVLAQDPYSAARLARLVDDRAPAAVSASAAGATATATDGSETPPTTRETRADRGGGPTALASADPAFMTGSALNARPDDDDREGDAPTDDGDDSAPAAAARPAQAAPEDAGATSLVTRKRPAPRPDPAPQKPPRRVLVAVAAAVPAALLALVLFWAVDGADPAPPPAKPPARGEARAEASAGDAVPDDATPAPDAPAAEVNDPVPPADPTPDDAAPDDPTPEADIAAANAPSPPAASAAHKRPRRRRRHARTARRAVEVTLAVAARPHRDVTLYLDEALLGASPYYKERLRLTTGRHVVRAVDPRTSRELARRAFRVAAGATTVRVRVPMPPP